MSGVLAACSDWHGGSAVANVEAQRQIVTILCARRPDAVVQCGDLVDLWRHTDALRTYGPFLAWAFGQYQQAGIPVYWVLGNHDWCDPVWLMGELRAANVPTDGLTISRPSLELGGWVFCHGHRLGDAFNDDRSPLFPVAKGIVRGVTWAADHLWSGLEASKLDPRKWISPSSRGAKAVQFVNEAAIDVAAKHQIRLCYGHTHRAGHADGDGWMVANCGAATTTHPVSYALLPPEGDPVIVTLQE